MTARDAQLGYFARFVPEHVLPCSILYVPKGCICTEKEAILLVRVVTHEVSLDVLCSSRDLLSRRQVPEE